MAHTQAAAYSAPLIRTLEARQDMGRGGSMHSNGAELLNNLLRREQCRESLLRRLDCVGGTGGSGSSAGDAEGAWRPRTQMRARAGDSLRDRAARCVAGEPVLRTCVLRRLAKLVTSSSTRSFSSSCSFLSLSRSSSTCACGTRRQCGQRLAVATAAAEAMAAAAMAAAAMAAAAKAAVWVTAWATAMVIMV
eukprot:3359727-Pleurochrysis_carterae.AAC.3